MSKMQFNAIDKERTVIIDVPKRVGGEDSCYQIFNNKIKEATAMV